ncbi:MarR family winged helix-turn-helix transcriptional regulator [Saccharopolyspora dendranthemae]|uniref:DNA-binding MarR family transcriptional regulator n=1 Tax=Saccharopolyspora dendranthemae TaxID=1181886 RepID=A0A561U7P2_9PSEU|nr:MarR family transcriptional regulator [Saccharopolyspora dendranthemae]TWF95390.1 DNA-binding MarR family transcriptional regulator [Saccharopolyspora dendranthemae]
MTDTASAGTELVLDVFRINGLLLAAGDRLADAEGLTSARWQVLGAIALAHEPLPVPHIARQMGLTRQSVQVSVNRLVADGMLASEPNVEHARSPLFDLTGHGAAAYERLAAAQQDWIGGLTTGLSAADLQAASHLLRTLSARLTSATTTHEQPHDPMRRATT